MRALVAVFLTLCCLWAVAVAAAEPDWCAARPQAPGLATLPQQASAKQILDAFVGIPYRQDGAVDAAGRFVLFAKPSVRFKAPGLNCSGFAVAALRLLLQDPVPLEQAKADRLGDSGLGAAMGQDWDFGWDFVLNMTAGRGGELLLPKGAKPLDAALAGEDGVSLRGFPLRDAAAWRQVLGRMQPGTVVLANFSKPWDKNGYSLLHHHVALILPLQNGQRWYYHAVGRHGVERIGLHDHAGLATLLRKYPASSLGQRRALLVSAPLP